MTKSIKTTNKTTSAKSGTRAVRKPREVVQEGPRGFRFGPSWNTSVMNATGAAIRDINRPKLLAHAKHYGLTVTKNADAATIAAEITKKMVKDPDALVY